MEANSIVETLCSKLKGKRPPIEIIEHKSKKRIKINKDNNEKISNTLNTKTDQKINMRKLQNEIFKFTTHFDAQNTEAKEQLAIKLGAKPRKKNHLNYKELKEKLKQNTEKKKHQDELFKLPKTMVRTSKMNNRNLNMKKNKQSIDIIKNYGTIKNKK
ncbi:Protein of unknown function DUF4602 [Cinara cedri]|uniref:Uncharacterized protein n=1 Tax=Cinara cedri TaxID=506608 RepID=A0A5E4MKR4_9HEMI|nr:Protein of unknown function DUF4602 [Cinara cedri]